MLIAHNAPISHAVQCDRDIVIQMSRHESHESRPWSKLESRLRNLVVPEINLRIRCTVYTIRTRHFTFDSPRHWITLDKKVIWDFPANFLAWKHPNVARPVEFLDTEYWPPKFTIATLLRHYLNCPVRSLLDEPFDDPWGLCDILRAADRRIGVAKLREWGRTLPADKPAQRVLAARLASAQMPHPGITTDPSPN